MSNNRISHVKNLGQVSAVVFGEESPNIHYVLWFDTKEDVLKAYDKGSGNWIPFTQSLINAENVGEGKGFIFKERRLSDSSLLFRTIKGVNGVEVSTEDNEVIIKLESYLNISQRNIVLNKNAGAVGILQIETNTDWKISFPNGRPTWAIFSKESGFKSDSVLISSSSVNSSQNSREFSFVVSATNGGSNLDPITIFVSQEGTIQSDSITITPSTWNFENVGGRKDFNVFVLGTIKDYVVTSVSNSNFQVSRMDSTTLSVIAGLNSGPSQRIATIVLTHASGTVTKELVVTQSGTTSYDLGLKPLTINGIMDAECQLV